MRRGVLSCLFAVRTAGCGLRLRWIWARVMCGLETRELRVRSLGVRLWAILAADVDVSFLLVDDRGRDGAV